MQMCESFGDAYYSMRKQMKIFILSTGLCQPIAGTENSLQLELFLQGQNMHEKPCELRFMVHIPVSWKPNHYLAVLYKIIQEDKVLVIEPISNANNVYTVNQVHKSYNLYSIESICKSYEYNALVVGGNLT